MKDKIIKSIAIATVTIISGALVAYLQDPKNRATVKAQYKKSKKEAIKQYKLLKKKLS